MVLSPNKSIVIDQHNRILKFLRPDKEVDGYGHFIVGTIMRDKTTKFVEGNSSEVIWFRFDNIRAIIVQ